MRVDPENTQLPAIPLVTMTASMALAADITISNQRDIRLSIALSYYENASGTLVTRGWWHVEPGGQTVITVDADESRDIYYAAYNKDQFVDISTRQNPKIMRWASPRNFEYRTDDEPSDSGIWQGKFYRTNGTSINVDGLPR